MLKLYHYPISPNSRRVWVALLEKQLTFELVAINLNGEQFQPDFLAINPFHHIPVLVDDDFTVVESLAILDYLEAKYPKPALLPADAKSVAIVRMVELVTVNELLPALNPLVAQMVGVEGLDPQKLEQAKQQAGTILNFFERLLGDNTYFGGSSSITLAEIVAGTVVPLLPMLGVSLDNYTKLSAWCDRLVQREAWTKTQPSPEAMEAAKSRLRERMAALQQHYPANSGKQN